MTTLKTILPRVKSLIRKISVGDVHVEVPLGSDAEVKKMNLNPPVNNLEVEIAHAALASEGIYPVAQRKLPDDSTGGKASSVAEEIDATNVDSVQKDALDSAERDRLHAETFVFPGDRRYPIPDAEHAKNALARSSGKPEQAKVREAVYAKYPELKPDDKVKKSADNIQPEPRRVARVLVRHGQHVLMGKRRDNEKWTTPGGHADPGEDLTSAAARETEEETGMDLSIEKMSPLTPVQYKTDAEGKPLHVQAFVVDLLERPATSMRRDPDAEVYRWRWVNTARGLPQHIADNLHAPKDDNILAAALKIQKSSCPPDPATADDAEPIEMDTALALNAIGYYWSDAKTSLVEANQPQILRKCVPIMKADRAKQIVYCVVIEPDDVDEQGDVMFEDDIEETAHDYMLNSRVVGSDHEQPIEAAPVESYIAPVDFEMEGPFGVQTVKKGSWVLGLKIFDPKEWSKVEDGSYTGVSIGGFGLRDRIAA